MSENGDKSKVRLRAQFRKPRVRLNFSRHVAGATATGDGPKTRPYMQGYDRELDSEDDETGEGMAFEEQLILRVPEGPGEHGELDALRQAIRRRSEYNDVWFKFKDSRRAVFHIGQQLYAAKLVDLPCIIESHKTLDNKQIFKIADISQMLLIERPIANESEATAATHSAKSSNDEYIYPHGITPPMQWARKRRFRKRVHNRSIDTVEKEVEGLLNDDKRAERVTYEFIDPAQADQIEQDVSQQKFSAADMEHHASDDEGKQEGGASAHADGDDDGDDDDDDDDDEGAMDDDDENVDQDLAAELDAALAREQGTGGEDESASDNEDAGAGSDDDARSAQDSDLEDLWDDDDDDDEAQAEADDDDAEPKSDKEDDDEGGEEEAERRVRESQLEAECREIESLIKRKQHDIESTMNALIKSRHQQALRKLQVEHDAKKRHLHDIKQIRRTIREERAADAAQEAANKAASAGTSTSTRTGAGSAAAPSTGPAATMPSTSSSATSIGSGSGAASGSGSGSASASTTPATGPGSGSAPKPSSGSTAATAPAPNAS